VVLIRPIGSRCSDACAAIASRSEARAGVRRSKKDEQCCSNTGRPRGFLGEEKDNYCRTRRRIETFLESIAFIEMEKLDVGVKTDCGKLREGHKSTLSVNGREAVISFV
jgi:hypothetical protein